MVIGFGLLVVPLAADSLISYQTLQQLNAVERDPGSWQAYRVAATTVAPDPGAPNDRDQVFRSGQSVLVEEITADALAKAAENEDHLGLLLALGCGRTSACRW